jgi:hypothetical protein
MNIRSELRLKMFREENENRKRHEKKHATRATIIGVLLPRALFMLFTDERSHFALNILTAPNLHNLIFLHAAVKN